MAAKVLRGSLAGVHGDAPEPFGVQRASAGPGIAGRAGRSARKPPRSPRSPISWRIRPIGAIFRDH